MKNLITNPSVDFAPEVSLNVSRNKLLPSRRDRKLWDEAVERRIVEHEELEEFADKDERKKDEGRWTNNGREM